MKKYRVTPTAEERQGLQGLIAAGKASARKLAHARISLGADAADGGPAWTDGRIDEASKQLIGEVIEPIPAEPGRPERIDYEYARNGAADLFMASGPPAGWRHVEVTERRTAKDFAEVVRWLVEEVHPDAGKIVSVT